MNTHMFQALTVHQPHYNREPDTEKYHTETIQTVEVA